MNYLASVTDFFKSPKWGMNLLFGAVTIFIPVIGPMVLQGWHITGFWAQRDERDPAKFPDFDFQYFGKYLGRGVWPFLVTFVASLVLAPVMLVVMFVPMISMGLFGHHSGAPGSGVPVLFMGLMFLVYLVFLVVFSGALIPLALRASITQDFGRSFDFGFIRSFLSRVWPELLIALLFMLGVQFVMIILTVVTCYIGGIFSFPIVFYAWHHLQKQLYQLHLSRGGEAIPMSASLADVPPALPI